MYRKFVQHSKGEGPCTKTLDRIYFYPNNLFFLSLLPKIWNNPSFARPFLSFPLSCVYNYSLLSTFSFNFAFLISPRSPNTPIFYDSFTQRKIFLLLTDLPEHQLRCLLVIPLTNCSVFAVCYYDFFSIPFSFLGIFASVHS